MGSCLHQGTGASNPILLLLGDESRPHFARAAQSQGPSLATSVPAGLWEAEGMECDFGKAGAAVPLSRDQQGSSVDSRAIKMHSWYFSSCMEERFSLLSLIVL